MYINILDISLYGFKWTLQKGYSILNICFIQWS